MAEITGSGASFLVTSKSAWAVIMVVEVAELLVESGSGSAAEADALLVRGPRALGATEARMVTVAEEAGARDPRLQVRVVAVVVQVPWLAVTERTVRSAGRVSVMWTLVAVEGP